VTGGVRASAKKLPARNLCRADRRADLEEQPVRLLELAQAGGVVAVQSGQLALSANEGETVGWS
jgi:hypothetical protein